MDAIASGLFFNQGQLCSGRSRLIVHRSRRDELGSGGAPSESPHARRSARFCNDIGGDG
ncbi:aldehyde dehydrogenase family protein [Rhodococcus sp. IEGM 248]|nr:aldehyde dehydrogenase family protein [Rhodococcus sp. IEGM 248]RZI53676.1 MAG: aldehyde dehydrogenase family protein [Pseudonocardia sp.]